MFGSEVHFMVAKIHIDEYVADIASKCEALSAKVATLTAKNAGHPATKTERQLGEETRSLTAAEKRLNEAAEFAKDGGVLPVAVSLPAEHPREVACLFSGSVERYRPPYASAPIQHDAMPHFYVEHGLSRYNLYDIDDVFDDPDNEGRGIPKFKQGSNGYVGELPDEFVLSVRPVAYAMKQFTCKLLSR